MRIVDFEVNCLASPPADQNLPTIATRRLYPNPGIHARRRMHWSSDGSTTGKAQDAIRVQLQIPVLTGSQGPVSWTL